MGLFRHVVVCVCLSSLFSCLFSFTDCTPSLALFFVFIYTFLFVSMYSCCPVRLTILLGKLIREEDKDNPIRNHFSKIIWHTGQVFRFCFFLPYSYYFFCHVFWQEMSVAAIAATAVSAGESFLPYMAATCGMLGPLMTLQEENMLNVRAFTEKWRCQQNFRVKHGVAAQETGKEERRSTIAWNACVFIRALCVPPPHLLF